MPLEPENRTLAEILREAGYRTGAVQTHPRLVKRSGFEQGFDDYLDDFRAHPLAEQSLGEALRWIDEASRDDRPWFLWVHVMDPHWTYNPPERFRTAFGPDDPRPRQVYEDIAANRRTIGPLIFQNAMPPDEVAAFVNLYDAELRYTDDALGKLLGALQGNGLDRNTLVVVTADHGESLGEQQYFFEHGDLGTQAEIVIPLALRLPGAIPEGTRVPTPRGASTWHRRSSTSRGSRPTAGSGGSRSGRCWKGPSGPIAPAGETDRSLHEEATARRELEGIAGKRRWVRLGDSSSCTSPGGTPRRSGCCSTSNRPRRNGRHRRNHTEIVTDLARRLEPGSPRTPRKIVSTTSCWSSGRRCGRSDYINLTWLRCGNSIRRGHKWAER